MKLITETHAEHIRGTLSCYDRIIIHRHITPFLYAKGMTSFLNEKKTVSLIARNSPKSCGTR